MHKGRLEDFTDGVIAVIITVMMLEMKVPHGSDFAALEPSLPIFLVYVLSYTNVAIFGTTTITCCRLASGPMAGFCGPTFSCCSGCPSCLLLSAGWTKAGLSTARRILWNHSRDGGGWLYLAGAVRVTLETG